MEGYKYLYVQGGMNENGNFYGCPKTAMQGGIESALQGRIKVSPCTRWDRQIY